MIFEEVKYLIKITVGNLFGVKYVDFRDRFDSLEVMICFENEYKGIFAIHKSNLDFMGIEYIIRNSITYARKIRVDAERENIYNVYNTNERFNPNTVDVSATANFGQEEYTFTPPLSSGFISTEYETLKKTLKEKIKKKNYKLEDELFEIN